MVSTQLHVLSLIRNVILDVPAEEGDVLEEDNLVRAINKVALDQEDAQILELQQAFGENYHRAFENILNKVYFEKMRTTNEYSRPLNKSTNGNFLFQTRCEPGKHSVIIFDPRTQKFFARTILVDVKLNSHDKYPKHRTYKQVFDQKRFELSKNFKINKLVKNDRLFLSDFITCKGSYS